MIVDDQTLFREGLGNLLSAQEGLSVVAKASDGIEALQMAAALLPDVVLMDVNMPRLGGIRAAAQITARHPSVHVLMLASASTDEAVVDALRAGALGYVLKDADIETLVDAIMRAAKGRQVLSRGSMRAVVAAAVGKSERRPLPADLSDRQYQILRLMSLGLDLKHIARELGLGAKTVRNQASLMYAKLGVSDRAQAILYAMHKGLAA